jgi:hypothetical protein
MLGLDESKRLTKWELRMDSVPIVTMQELNIYYGV